jgi:peptidyl-prolyl cis-trans isomerase C
MKTLVAPLCAVVLLTALVGCRRPPSAGTTAAAQGVEPAQTPKAPPKPMPAQLPDILAKVNGEAVTKGDFDRLVKNMELGNGPIPADRRDEILRGALDQLITYTVLVQEAKSRNITVTDAEVDARLKQMRGQFPTEAEFKKAVEARGMSLEQMTSDTRHNLEISKMVEAEVAQAGAVTDADAQDFYGKNPDKFKQGEAVRASHILIMVDQKADDATRKKAKEKIDGILKQARGGEDFAKLAKEHSQDGSASAGGDLNFFTKGQMVPQFDQAAFAMKPGQISDVVETQFGYHIIKVTDRREPGAVPFEQVRDRISQFLAGQKKQDRANAFIEAAKKKAKIEVLV